MISQAVITRNNEVLMVRQYVQRGDIVWNFPGGGIEEGETPEEACLREVEEETGFKVRVIKLLKYENDKYTFKAEIVGGQMELDKTNKDNEDIIEIAWITLQDQGKFDDYTKPLIKMIL
jgi:mutator protein MutT